MSGYESDGSGVDDKEIDDDAWLYDLWTECPHTYCIWVDEEIDETDYFLSPRSRWFPHAMCRDEWVSTRNHNHDGL